MPDPQQPAGRARLQTLHAFLVKEYGDAPTDYNTFETKLLEDPARMQGLYQQLSKDGADVPGDYATFELKLTEGLKKKESGSASVTPAPASPPTGTPAPLGSTAGEPVADTLAQAGESEQDAAYRLQAEAEQATGALGTFMPRETVPTPESLAGIKQASAEYDAEQAALQQKREDDYYRSLAITGAMDRFGVPGSGTVLQWLSDFSTGAYNNIVPGTMRNFANLLEGTGDLVQSRGALGEPATDDKWSDELADKWRKKAAELRAYLPPAYEQDVLEHPTSGAAWTALASSAFGSLSKMMIAGRVAGAPGAMLVGGADAYGGVYDAAEQAGLNDDEKAVFATALAVPLMLLDKVGLEGVLAKKAAQAGLAKAVLREAGEDLSEKGIAAAVGRVMPKLVAAAKQTGRTVLQGAKTEGVTEAAQSAVENATYYAYDAASGNLGQPKGNGSFGTLENGYGQGALDILKQAGIEGLVGTAMAGSIEGLKLDPATNQVSTADGQAAPQELTVTLSDGTPAVVRPVEVAAALQAGKIEAAVQAGKLKPEHAVEVIEAAGLEVPESLRTLVETAPEVDEQPVAALDESEPAELAVPGTADVAVPADGGLAPVLSGQSADAVGALPEETPAAPEAAPQPAETRVGEEFPIVRIDQADFDPAQPKPHGLYVSTPADPANFTSPFEDDGDTRYTGVARPKNPLRLTETTVRHARFGWRETGAASAGVAALKTLVPEAEFSRLAALPKAELAAELEARFPGPDYGRYHDSYELLEVYGAELARQAGYDALILPDSQSPDLSEAVLLDPAAAEWDNRPASTNSGQAPESGQGNLPADNAPTYAARVGRSTYSVQLAESGWVVTNDKTGAALSEGSSQYKAAVKQAEAARSQQEQEAKREKAHNSLVATVQEYNNLGGTQRNGRQGAQLRQKIAQLAAESGLVAKLRGDGKYSLTTQDGKRVTSTKAATTLTSPATSAPLAERRPEVQQATRELVDMIDGNAATMLPALNFKQLGFTNARDLQAAVKDVQQGKHTKRAEALIQRAEEAAERGYFTVDDPLIGPYPVYTGEAARPSDMRAWGEDTRSDEDIADLLAAEPDFAAFIDSVVADEEGNIDLNKLADKLNGPAAANLLGAEAVNSEAFQKLRTYATEQTAANRPAGAAPDPAAAPQPEADQRGAQTPRVAAASQPAEVSDRLAAIEQERQAAIEDFKRLLKKPKTQLNSSFIGLDPDIAIAAARIVKTYVQEGVVRAEDVIARFRAEVGNREETTLSDDDLALLVQMVQGRAAQAATLPQPEEAPLTENAKTRRSMERYAADPNSPEGLVERIRETGLDKYEPRSLADAEAFVERQMQVLSLNDAIDAAVSGTLLRNGDTRTALRVKVLNVLNTQIDAALERGDQAAADALHEKAFEVAEAIAKRGTDLGQELNAYKLLAAATHSPASVVVDTQKAVREQRESKLGKARKVVATVAKRARTAKKKALDAALNTAAVQDAEARVVEWQQTGSKPKADPASAVAPDSPAYGATNRYFTKQGYQDLKKRLKGLAFSTPLPPDLVYLGAYHIEAGARRFADFSKKVLRDVGARVKPHLAQLYEEAKAELVSRGAAIDGTEGPDGVALALEKEQAAALAKRVVKLVEDKDGDVQADPTKRMLQTLLKKVQQNLPKTPKQPSLTQAQQVVEAIERQAEFAAVWERAKADTEALIDNLPDTSSAQKKQMHEALEDFYQEVIGQPYADAQLTGAVKEGLKGADVSLDQLAREFLVDEQQAGKDLAAYLVKRARLSPQQAQYYAAVVEEEFAKQLEAKRASILDGIYSRLVRYRLPNKTRTALEKVQELFALSPTSDERIVGLVAKELDLPELTVEQVQQLRQLAAKAQAAPEGWQKIAATEELLKAQARVAGLSFMDMANAMWYAHGLMGPKTHAINMYTTGLAVLEENIISTLYQLGRTRSLAAFAPWRGLTHGFAQGARDAGYVWQTGHNVYSDYKVEVPSELEVYRALDPATASGVKKLWAYLSKYPELLRYVGRALRAEDAFFTGGAKEMRAWEYAMMEADRQGKGQPTKAIWQQASETLYGTKERFAAAEQQAKAEGLQGRDYKRRVFEIVEQSRPAALREDSLRWARRTTFNSAPKGTVGALAGVISQATRLSIYGFRPLMFLAPYTRVPANIANRALEYTPLGYLRAIKGGIGFHNKAYGQFYDPYTPEEKSKAAIRATAGLALMALFYAWSHDKDEEGQPQLEITGYGPRDFAKRQQWMQAGNRPYSVRKRGSGVSVSYQGMPWAAAMVAAGTIRDMEQFEGKTWADRDMTDRAFLLAVKTAQYNMNLTSTRGLYEGLDAFNNPNSDALLKYGNRLVGNSLKNYLLPGGALTTQLSKTAQNIAEMPKKEVNGILDVIVQDIPFARRGLTDAVDALGERIVVDTDRVFGEPQPRSAESQRIWAVLLKKRAFISIPDRRTLTIANLETRTEEPATPEQYHDFLVARGEILRALLGKQLALIERSPRPRARKIVSRATRLAGQRAKIKVFGPAARVKLPEEDEY
ncbi:hypothetical protein [Hymenobacter latericus]|uniref:hypothetical protein n=1 Tax=Hymenobacter sp. YIM 151858-1 TaxID=2987688 RepID=UPI002226803C|nr:hypothetical protein [Hymenobacter sp. YIM 151858-1]UYZ60122.1 hypothetical protein OIS50_04800 [Hymenobacter sp. YIM 151858-1]